jgi:uncharacterized cysteine cluster protein YcgN (CxxCxxCC family)
MAVSVNQLHWLPRQCNYTFIYDAKAPTIVTLLSRI